MLLFVSSLLAALFFPMFYGCNLRSNIILSNFEPEINTDGDVVKHGYTVLYPIRTSSRAGLFETVMSYYNIDDDLRERVSNNNPFGRQKLNRTQFPGFK